MIKLVEPYGDNSCQQVAINVFFGKRVSEDDEGLRKLLMTMYHGKKTLTNTALSKLKIDCVKYQRKELFFYKGEIDLSISRYHIIF